MEWAEKIHNWVQQSDFEDLIEEWEEDEQERCVAYTLFDGTSVIVYDNGLVRRIDQEGHTHYHNIKEFIGNY